MNKGEFIPVDDKDGFIEKVAHDVVRQLTKEEKKGHWRWSHGCIICLDWESTLETITFMEWTHTMVNRTICRQKSQIGFWRFLSGMIARNKPIKSEYPTRSLLIPVTDTRIIDA